MPEKPVSKEVRAFLDALLGWRTRHQLGQRKAAEKLGVHHVTLARWESGQRSPSKMARRALENILKK